MSRGRRIWTCWPRWPARRCWSAATPLRSTAGTGGTSSATSTCCCREPVMDGRVQRGELRCQLVEGVVRVQSARVRQYPHAGGAEGLRLDPERRLRPAVRDPVGGHAEDDQPARAVVGELGGEQVGTGTQFLGGQFVGPGGGPRGHVRDAQPV